MEALSTFSGPSDPIPETRGQYFTAFSSPDFLEFDDSSSSFFLLIMVSHTGPGKWFLLVTDTDAIPYRFLKVCLLLFKKTFLKTILSAPLGLQDLSSRPELDPDHGSGSAEC